MKVRATRDFTLAGETHQAGDVFEVDTERGAAWIIANVVEEYAEESDKTDDVDD